MSLADAIDFLLVSLARLTEPGRPWPIADVTAFGRQHGWLGSPRDLEKALELLARVRPPLLVASGRLVTLTAEGRLTAEERLRALLGVEDDALSDLGESSLPARYGN